MGKPRSPETEVRRLKRWQREKTVELVRVTHEANSLRYKLQLAMRDVDEWKQRFDALLARTPEVPRG